MKLTLLRGFLIFSTIILFLRFPTADSSATKPLFSSSDPSFDWREHGYDFPVKDQGWCNAGYAFAAVDAVQAAIWKKDDVKIDFSVNHAKECNWHAFNNYSELPNTCEGGNFQMLANLFTQQGLVLETCDPYVDDDIDCNQSCQTQYYIKEWQQFSPSDEMAPIELIKQKLVEYGPLYTQMDPTISGFSSYTGKDVLTGSTIYEDNWYHGVLIVGWDDELGSVGAWIVKNSYGAGWGDEGYFYIAYGNAGIGSSLATVTGWEKPSPFNYVHSYDEAGHTSQMSTGDEDFFHGKSMAMFNVQKNEFPKAIEFWTNDTGRVNVRIYDQFTGNKMSNLLYQSGEVEIDFRGYHQILIDPGFVIPEDREFFIELEVTNKTWFHPIVVDHLGISSDKTWYQDQNGNWLPLSTMNFDAAIRLRTIVLPDGWNQRIFLPFIVH